MSQEIRPTAALNQITLEEETTLPSGQHALPLKRTAGTFQVQLFIRTVEFPKKTQPKPEPIASGVRLRQTGIAIAAVLAPLALAALAVFVF